MRERQVFENKRITVLQSEKVVVDGEGNFRYLKNALE
jgi:hypothetical protein